MSRLMKFEDVRILRDMRNSVNRLVNCETANMNKTIGAAQRQVGNIEFIENTIGLDQLPDRLQEIARLRVENQDITLKELGELVSGGTVSKSGVNHRLRKIEEIAENLRNGGIGSRESVLEKERVTYMAEKTVEVKMKTWITSTASGIIRPRSKSFYSGYIFEKR